MKSLTKIALTFLLLVIIPADIFASNPAKRGTAGAVELLLPVGARGTSLAGSMLSSPSGVEAIHWNPAGLAAGMRGSSVETMFSHMNYIAEVDVDYAAVGIKFGKSGALGFSFRTVDFGDIPVTTEDFPSGTGETFSPTFVSIGVSYARQLTDRILVGATTKIITESILRTSALGIALDAGVIYSVKGGSPLSGLRFGVALKHIGPSMRFRGEDLERQVIPPDSDPAAVAEPLSVVAQSFELPSAFELGLSYDVHFVDKNRLTIMGAFQNANFGNDHYLGGLEYAYNDQLFLRAGYGSSDRDSDRYIYGVTLGAGVSYPLGNLSVNVDYAYMDTEFFEGTNTFSVRLGF